MHCRGLKTALLIFHDIDGDNETEDSGLTSSLQLIPLKE